MTVLVTGGAGYIGSHVCVELLNGGFDVVVADNLYNSSKEALNRVREITGKSLRFYEEDVLDRGAMYRIFEENSIDAVVHLAGLKSVGESVIKPIEYYHNNVCGMLTLTEAMRFHRCRNIIFSSSATVYGDPAQIPVTEDCPGGTCANPYGWSKRMQEQILTDIHTSDPRWNAVLLRYFNPTGAHESGRIGEDPRGIPDNLLPFVAQVAVGKRERLGVFGDDYDTPDGTGVRDYIHVVDLAKAHVKALAKLEDGSGLSVYNLGTGRGYSVLEVVCAFERACGHSIPYEIRPRRPGDVAVVYCDPTRAKEQLGWEARRSLDEMCADAWRWQSANPNGYDLSEQQERRTI